MKKIKREYLHMERWRLFSSGHPLRGEPLEEETSMDRFWGTLWGCNKKYQQYTGEQQVKVHS